jgi:hypothetical protein
VADKDPFLNCFRGVYPLQSKITKRDWPRILLGLCTIKFLELLLSIYVVLIVLDTIVYLLLKFFVVHSFSLQQLKRLVTPPM